MKAKVKDSYPWSVMRSCGVEFVKGAFRQVPAGTEAEAMRNPDLEFPKKRKISVTGSAVDLAAFHNIDLATVKGTGADGRITKADVEKVIPEEPADVDPDADEVTDE